MISFQDWITLHQRIDTIEQKIDMLTQLLLEETEEEEKEESLDEQFARTKTPITANDLKKRPRKKEEDET